MAAALASPRETGLRRVSNVVLLAIGVLFLLPLTWLLLSSVNPQARLAVEFPETFSFENFSAVLTTDTTFRPLANSFALAGGATVITVVAAILAAYPLSRFRMRFNKPFMYGVLFGTCLPITAMMVPVYSLFVSLNLFDSMIGTAFFMAATSLPMAIWMTKNFMDSVPISLEEAAWVDGATAMVTLRRIVVPLMRQGLAVVSIFVFVQGWGNFFVPFVLLQSPDKSPAAVSIFTFFGQYGAVAYGQLAAFSLLYALPAVVLYVLTSRIGGGFQMAGAVKG